MWLDVRNTDTVDEVLAKIRDKNQDYLKPLCGLPISTYFSALKVKWLVDNVPEVKLAIEEKRCYFGTVDTWLMWVCKCTGIFSSVLFLQHSRLLSFNKLILGQVFEILRVKY